MEKKPLCIRNQLLREKTQKKIQSE
jgi:hypothetical protein